MEIGAIFPQTELSADPGAIREFVQAVEAMGYANLFVADHVLGADTRFHHHPSLASYSYTSVVHEPLTLLGYMAAITTRITLATGILILPQRQTALVAKQAAEALNQDFHTRGRRSAEQIAVLRALWTQEVVDFHGQWHHITHAGLNPLPVQRPIPIWLGVGSSQNPQPPEAVLRRVARLADGWSPNIPTNADGTSIVARVHHYAKEAGRDPAALPLEGRVRIAGKSPAEWVNLVQAWAGLGATHIIVETRGGGLVFPQQHLAALRQFKDVVGPVLA